MPFTASPFWRLVVDRGAATVQRTSFSMAMFQAVLQSPGGKKKKIAAVGPEDRGAAVARYWPWLRRLPVVMLRQAYGVTLRGRRACTAAETACLVDRYSPRGHGYPPALCRCRNPAGNGIVRLRRSPRAFSAAVMPIHAIIPGFRSCRRRRAAALITACS